MEKQSNFGTMDISGKVAAAIASQGPGNSAREVKPSGNPAMSATGMDGQGVKAAIGG